MCRTVVQQFIRRRRREVTREKRIERNTDCRSRRCANFTRCSSFLYVCVSLLLSCLFSLCVSLCVFLSVFHDDDTTVWSTQMSSTGRCPSSLIFLLPAVSVSHFPLIPFLSSRSLVSEPEKWRCLPSFTWKVERKRQEEYTHRVSVRVYVCTFYDCLLLLFFVRFVRLVALWFSPATLLHPSHRPLLRLLMHAVTPFSPSKPHFSLPPFKSVRLFSLTHSSVIPSLEKRFPRVPHRSVSLFLVLSFSSGMREKQEQDERQTSTKNKEGWDDLKKKSGVQSEPVTSDASISVRWMCMLLFSTPLLFAFCHFFLHLIALLTRHTHKHLRGRTFMPSLHASLHVVSSLSPRESHHQQMWTKVMMMTPGWGMKGG